MNAPPLLRMNRISKSFGAVRALVDVDFQVDRHEIVALVGDNAAGKSTLARIIAGVHQPTSGTMLLNGEPAVFSKPAAAQARGIATVFQGLALADNLDVTANIFLGREIRVNGLLAEERMEQMAREYLDRLNARIANPRTPVAQLSAGQRQCVAIARTLVGDPQLVVLDEPTASLSVAQTAEVLNHIQGLRTLGLGVVLISHSLTDVRAVADRIDVLRHGRMNGSFTAPHDAYEEIIAAITGATTVRR
ncbi:ATP-binding cassette domain-containing protein [Demequina capsici]|uniref:ATP-binding cassette domain-containing protein n=1 Tax=Demequina capsici TaxID=3075620 RepID=A0AA96FDK9_9MICO|nr:MULTISPECIES: ATP-binding cassette domain-containing protein [unclassified Demequina]WNM24725.1 ATP-binding cassette domain-containing protein [Demequina sp. OYTSA14]WNM27634.1 ATP-binding cassette domain-containing protein [Demequina sp. PMTSA13]